MLLAVELGAGATVLITRVRFRAGNDRLRVAGDVTPVTSSATLFTGPADVTDSFCTGTFVANLVVGGGSFAFDSGNGGFPVNPGQVCVSSDNGRADSALVP